MSIEKLRGNLAHATKIKAPGHVLCATVSEVEAALLDYNALMVEVAVLRRELADLKEFAYERAPKIATEQANKQTKESRAEIERLRHEIGCLDTQWKERHGLVVVRAEEAEEREDNAKAEIERLRLELGYIANAKRKSFTDAEEFRTWAQNRARHALGLKPGELTIRKGNQ